MAAIPYLIMVTFIQISRNTHFKKSHANTFSSCKDDTQL